MSTKECVFPSLCRGGGGGGTVAVRLPGITRTPSPTPVAAKGGGVLVPAKGHSKQIRSTSEEWPPHSAGGKGGGTLNSRRGQGALRSMRHLSPGLQVPRGRKIKKQTSRTRVTVPGPSPSATTSRSRLLAGRHTTVVVSFSPTGNQKRNVTDSRARPKLFPAQSASEAIRGAAARLGKEAGAAI